MRFGPTSLNLPSVLAKGLHRPKLRSDLRISEQHVSGETSFIVKIVDTSSYNRYGAFEYELLTLFDGTRTPAEVATDLTELHPENPVQESDMLGISWIPRTPISGNARWARRIWRCWSAFAMSVSHASINRALLYIYFKAWNPDRTLRRMEPYLRWMFTPRFRDFFDHHICRSP